MPELKSVSRKWIDVQERTFRNWCNSKLKNHPKNIKIEEKLDKVFHDGLNLIYLIETLDETSFPYDYFKTPRFQLHCHENLSLSLKHLKRSKIKLVNIDYSDIYDGNLKLILGLLWQMIKTFDLLKNSDPMQGYSTSDKELAKSLLAWANKVLKDYNLSLSDFKNWQDGKPFGALIHALQHKGPSGFEWNSNGDPEKQVGKSMQIAEDDHFIPRLMDPADLLNAIDLLSTMTLVGLIKNEYENGPQQRLKAKLRLALAKNSTFRKISDENQVVAKFEVVLKNFQGEPVPHCNDLEFLRFEAEHHPSSPDGSPQLLNCDVTAEQNGKYLMALLTDSPGSYHITAKFKDEMVQKPVSFDVESIEAEFETAKRTFCLGKKSFAAIKVAGNDKVPPSALSINNSFIFKESEKSASNRTEVVETTAETPRKQSSFKPNVEVMEVLRGADNRLVVPFVGRICGECIFSGTIKGQKIRNDFAFRVEQPNYKARESDRNNYCPTDRQEFIVEAFDARGKLMDGFQPTAMIQLIEGLAVAQEKKDEIAVDEIGEESEIEMTKELKSKEKKMSESEKTTPESEKTMTESEKKMSESEKTMTESEKTMTKSEKTEKESLKNAPMKEEKVEIMGDDGEFTVQWIPRVPGKYKVTIRSKENALLLDKEYNVQFVPCPENSTLKRADNEDKAFEEITHLKFHLNMLTRSKTPLPSADTSSLNLAFDKLEHRSSKDEDRKPETKISIDPQKDDKGTHICSFATDTAGVYEINATLDGKAVCSNGVTVVFEKKPLWELHGEFKSCLPNTRQKIKLVHKDREGNRIPSNDQLRCEVRKRGEEAEDIEKSGDDVEREFEWVASVSGIYDICVELNGVSLYKFEGVMVRNEVSAENSLLECLNKAVIETEQPIKFQITLNDKNGDCVGQGGDEDDLSVKYRKIYVNDEDNEKSKIESIDEIVSSGNGQYTFTFVANTFSEYNFMAYYKNQKIPPTVKASIVPFMKQNKMLLPGELFKISDDNVFLRFFKPFAEKGTEIEKYRYNKPLLGGAKSKNTLRLVNVDSDDIGIVYNKFSCPLLNVSQIFKGRRTQVFKEQKVDQSLCFSVVTNTRTIDLKCGDPLDRDIWVRGLRLCIQLDAIKSRSLYKGY